MIRDSQKRTILKTILFRVIGITITVLWLKSDFTSNEFHMALAMNMSALVVYYLYERTWTSIQWGKERINGKKGAIS